MKALNKIFLVTFIVIVSNSFCQQKSQPDSVIVTKATANQNDAIHEDFSLKRGDPLKTGNIYYFDRIKGSNQVGEIVKIDSNSVTIKNYENETVKIKKRYLVRVYNIRTNPIFAHAKPHRADIKLRDTNQYTDVKIIKLGKDSLIIKVSSKSLSIPLENIESVDFAETPSLLSNSGDIVYLLMFWPLLPLALMDSGFDTEFDFSNMDVKWKYSMIRCLLSYKYPGRFLNSGPSKF